MSILQSKMKAALIFLSIVVCCMAAPQKKNVITDAVDNIKKEAQLLLDCGGKGTQAACQQCCADLDGHWDGTILDSFEQQEIGACKNACTLLP